MRADDEITLFACGTDAQDAINALAALAHAHFGEADAVNDTKTVNCVNKAKDDGAVSLEDVCAHPSQDISGAIAGLCQWGHRDSARGLIYA
ncbi:hypothetical protein P4S72_26610 [Vibrio sp. PP-XX7]